MGAMGCRVAGTVRKAHRHGELSDKALAWVFEVLG